MPYLRITMGTLKGRVIPTHAKAVYRPMPAGLREAFFNRFAPDLKNRRFLDGFAGTGIMGLYALSLGCLEAGFIEKSNRALQAIQSCLDRFGLKDRAWTWAAPIEKVLKLNPPKPFYMVFLGPPYNTPNATIQYLQERLADRQWTTEKSVLAIQRFKKTEPPKSAAWVHDRPIRHGDNILYIYRRKRAGSPPGVGWQ